MATVRRLGRQSLTAEVVPTCKTAASSSTFSAWLGMDSWSRENHRQRPGPVCARDAVLGGGAHKVARPRPPFPP